MSIDLKGWLKQPTTIHGIGGFAAVIVGGGVYYVTRDAAMASMAGGSAFSAVCTAMNDNSGDKSSVEKLVTDGINAAVTKHLADMMPTLAADVRHVLSPSVVVPAAAIPSQAAQNWTPPKPPNT